MLKDCPEKNTCPTIDEAIDELKTLSTNVEGFAISNINEEVEYVVNNVTSLLEELRSANSNLREWGSAMYDYASGLEGEIEQLKQERL